MIKVRLNNHSYRSGDQCKTKVSQKLSSRRVGANERVFGTRLVKMCCTLPGAI